MLSNERGLATFDGLPAGRYSIQATFAGFERGLIREVSLRRGDNRHVVVLPLQSVTETVNVGEGQSVETGDLLFVLEAMKMENPIHAPAAGIVGPIHAEVGDSLAAGTLLTQLVLSEVN